MLGIVNTAAAGDTTLVAAVTGKKIRVKKFQLVNGVATANNVKFRTGTTDLHAALPLPLAAGLSIEAEDDGDGPDDFLFETVGGGAAGDQLVGRDGRLGHLHVFVGVARVASHTINGQAWPSGTVVSVYSANALPVSGDGTPAGWRSRPRR
jgi:hypothetical protein